jgi:hypothetical protein
MEISKMGLSNESPLLDSPVMPWLNHTIKKFSRKRGSDYLFNLDYPTWRRGWENALASINLPRNHSTLYQHSGPSHDRLHGLRSALAVKMRRRWLADSSVRRYECHARLHQQFQQLPPLVQQQGLEAVSKLEKLVLRCSPQ